MPDKSLDSPAGKVCEALESFQLSEIVKVNSLLLDLQCDQQGVDLEIERTIGLHQRLCTRSRALESMSLNLQDGRESLNTLVRRGPECVKSMRDDLRAASASVTSFLGREGSPASHSWLSDSPSMRRALEAMSFRP